MYKRCILLNIDKEEKYNGLCEACSFFDKLNANFCLTFVLVIYNLNVNIRKI